MFNNKSILITGGRGQVGECVVYCFSGKVGFLSIKDLKKYNQVA